ncbi:endonuclease/exonuclease/phosphatase family protein [Ferrimonas senticii]|uniref:endonuclease/exonuclease/phosphatase family protein n=1 Tax=Ferrimonas senticii TaxID=394566 RepID=UPI00041257EE|nr:endonuclease/exonuclease/phosphatase family protein [Ferrimonas senticii]
MKRIVAAVALLLAIGLAIGIGYHQLPQPAAPQVIALPESTSTPLPRRFTLLNWNIQKRSYEPQWQQQLAEILERQQPLLLMLQEVALQPAQGDPSPLPANFAPNLGLHAPYSGVLTAASSPALSAQTYLSTPTEPLSNTPKVALFCEYQLADQRLLVINIHAINFVDDDSYRRQLSQIVNAAEAHQGPLILGGDLNSWSDSRTAILNQQIAKLQLQPVTFNQQQKIKAFFGHRLDHIYVSNHFSVIDAQALPSYQSSDHIPMIATLELR